MGRKKTWLRWCLCALPVSKKPPCFSVMQRCRYAILSRTNKGRNTRMCKDNVLTHTYTQTHTHTHTHPAGRHFPSVLFPSATVGYDTAEKYSEGSDGRGRNDEPRRSRLPT